MKVQKKLSIEAEEMGTVYRIPEQCPEEHKNGTLINNFVHTNTMWK